MFIRDLYSRFNRYRCHCKVECQDRKYINSINSLKSQIRYYNFFDFLQPDTFWFTRFLHNRTKLVESDKSVAIISVFGGRDRLKYATADIRLFYSGENLHSHFIPFSDHMLSDDNIDLALGFDLFEDKRYMRFPLWLLYMIDPEASDEQICDYIRLLRNPNVDNEERKKFCAMVASHDNSNVRGKITLDVSSISDVMCAGKFMHNDDTLLSNFNDNKQEYLKQFMFNTCPENTNAYGYVTEKIFECIRSGCIPIYWGSYNNPEPEIINKDAVIFFDPKEDNSEQIALIEELYTRPKLMSEFSHQDRLLPGAEDCILSMIHEFAEKFNNLL